MKLPVRPKQLANFFNPEEPRKSYNTLVTIRYLLTIISPESEWETRLVKLLDDYPVVDPGQMGFPRDWSAMDVWSNSDWAIEE